MVATYYNEIEPYAADWLRNLIKAGQIPAGEVDERSIEDVSAQDLAGFSQAHFFAGIGGWPLALRLAGWSDDRPVWTGSCPCQPFSNAGQRSGADDKRHLWPVWWRLIQKCRPPVIFGEQVASPLGEQWLDLVLNDLEAADYACGAVVLPACSVGAPHIRQRLWIVAHTDLGAGRQSNGHATQWGRSGHTQQAGMGSSNGRLGYSSSQGSGRHARTVPGAKEEGTGEWQHIGGLADLVVAASADRKLGHPIQAGLSQRERVGGVRSEATGAVEGQAIDGTGHRSFWSDVEWLECSDGRARPVEPGLKPLVTGVPCRASQLRAYGNAISPQVAAQVIAAFDDTVFVPRDTSECYPGVAGPVVVQTGI